MRRDPRHYISVFPKHWFSRAPFQIESLKYVCENKTCAEPEIAAVDSGVASWRAEASHTRIVSEKFVLMPGLPEFETRVRADEFIAYVPSFPGMRCESCDALLSVKIEEGHLMISAESAAHKLGVEYIDLMSGLVKGDIPGVAGYGGFVDPDYPPLAAVQEEDEAAGKTCVLGANVCPDDLTERPEYVE